MQFRFHTFQRPLDSFEENLRTLGMLQAGRYRGYDAFVQGGALDGTLIHTTTGVDKTNIALAVTPNQSALITPQGVMIYETDAVDIGGFTSNAGNNDRLDLIILEHEYLDSVGGQAATYSIITGTPASGVLDIPVAPGLTNPEKQVIIGTMFIPGGDANLNTAIYTAGVPTKPNGQGLALLDQVQQFSMMQQWSQGTNTEIDADNLIKLSTDGNHFLCEINNTEAHYMQAMPVGTIISLHMFTGSGGTSSTFTQLEGSPPVGYSSLFTPSDVIFANGDVILWKMTTVGWAPIGSKDSFLDIQTNAADIATNVSDIATNINDIADIVAGELPNGIKTDGTLLKTKVIPIGDWDMDTEPVITVNHGLSAFEKIRFIQVMIIPDDSAVITPLNSTSFAGIVEGAVGAISGNIINLIRINGGQFDATIYNATSFNRGWITITYEA